MERRRVNEAARAYNSNRRQFPAVLFAGIMGFGERPYFEATAGADAPPEVEF